MSRTSQPKNQRRTLHIAATPREVARAMFSSVPRPDPAKQRRGK